MKINKENLNTKKETIPYQNDDREINICHRQQELQFRESKYVWLMISTFYILEFGYRCVFCQKEGSVSKDGE